VLPLKSVLKELADYDHKKKIYTVKKSLIWWFFQEKNSKILVIISIYIIIN
jgi:hypothetical protein